MKFLSSSNNQQAELLWGSSDADVVVVLNKMLNPHLPLFEPPRGGGIAADVFDFPTSGKQSIIVFRWLLSASSTNPVPRLILRVTRWNLLRATCLREGCQFNCYLLVAAESRHWASHLLEAMDKQGCIRGIRLLTCSQRAEGRMPL